MSQQTLVGTPTRLAGVSAGHLGKKIRISGRWLTYDESTGFAIVVDEGAGLLVDAALCVGPGTGPWIRERWSTVTAIGYVEACDSNDAQCVPALPPGVKEPGMKPGLVFRALLVTPTPDLDLRLLNESIREEFEAGEVPT